LSIVFGEDYQYNKYLQGWKVDRVYTHNDQKDDSGYYGVLYINKLTEQMVFAHRGTKFESRDLLETDSSLQTDIKGVFGGQIVGQQAAAYEFTKEIIDYAKSKNYHLSTTGHSLGGWLAELSLYFSHRDFDYHKMKAIIFDSPGLGLNMDKFRSNIYS
jgi:hypothetical protein